MATTQDTRPDDNTFHALSPETARLSALMDAQRAVAEAGDLHAMFQRIADCALVTIEAAEGAVVEVLDGGEFIYDAVSGSLSPHGGIRLAIGPTLSGRAVREGRSFVVSDAAQEPDIDPAIMRRLGVRSAVIVPVSRQNETIGVLKVQSSKPNAFTTRDLLTGRFLAGLIAYAFGDAAEARSRRALRDAESRQRQIFESVTEFAVIVTDRTGLVTEWNTGAERIFGWTAEEMCGRDASIFFTAEDREVDRSGTEMRQSLAEGRAVDERWHLKKDGSRFFSSGNMMPLRGDSGEHLGFIKIVRDRTEQHLAGTALAESRQALEASERKWRGLFEGLQEGFVLGQVVRDAANRVVDWRYEEVNHAWSRLVGMTPEAAIGRTVRELIPGVEEEWVSEFAAVVETGSPVRFTRQVGALGRWYDGVVQPVGDDRFSVLFVDATVRMSREARQLALLELGDALRDADNVEAAALAASAIVGRTLGASRAGFGLVDASRETAQMQSDWCAPGIRSVAGSHSFRDFGTFIEELKRGEAAIIHDVETDPRTSGHVAAFGALDIRSMANLPILARGRLVAVACAHFAQVHEWTEADTAFLRDVADRTQHALARLQAETDRSLLNRELAHRLKNTLAIVQSIATQTLRTAPDTMAARKTLTERIQALSKAHDILLSGQRDAASIREVVRSATELHDGGGRVRLSGPELTLGPKASLTLSLIMHELATNAGKYGALSEENGYVAVEWTVAPDPASGHPHLVLEWREIGGPPVAPPTRRSFGTRLVEMGLSGAVDGSSEITYAPDGLRCRLTASLTELQSENEA